MSDNSSRCGVRRAFNWDSVEPAVAVIETITELEDCDATDSATVLEQPLQTHFDTDSLNTLVRSDNVCSITLDVADYHIQINKDTVGATRVDS